MPQLVQFYKFCFFYLRNFNQVIYFYSIKLDPKLVAFFAAYYWRVKIIFQFSSGITIMSFSLILALTTFKNINLPQRVLILTRNLIFYAKPENGT